MSGTPGASTTPWAPILLGFLLGVGCGFLLGAGFVGRGPTLASDVITNVDYEIFDTVLSDFLTRDEDLPYPARAEAKALVLGDTTASFVEPTYLPKDVSPDLVSDMMSRNPKRVRHTLRQYRPKDPNILVRDVTGVDSELGNSGVLYGTRGFVSLALPGYSKDGQMALCGFGYGPSPHGMACFYLLRKQDRIRTVVKHSKFDFT